MWCLRRVHGILTCSVLSTRRRSSVTLPSGLRGVLTCRVLSIRRRRAVRLPSGPSLRVLFSQLLLLSPRHLFFVSLKGRSSFPACPSFVNVTLVPFLVLAVRCSAESHRAWPMSRSSCSRRVDATLQRLLRAGHDQPGWKTRRAVEYVLGAGHTRLGTRPSVGGGRCPEI
jgi:hypothetical protein